jgi:hypothetical protein
MQDPRAEADRAVAGRLDSRHRAGTGFALRVPARTARRRLRTSEGVDHGRARRKSRDRHRRRERHRGGLGTRARRGRGEGGDHRTARGPRGRRWPTRSPRRASRRSGSVSTRPRRIRSRRRSRRAAEEARARNVFVGDDLAAIERFLREDVHWNSPWGGGPTNRTEVLEQFGMFNESSGGTMRLT